MAEGKQVLIKSSADQPRIRSIYLGSEFTRMGDDQTGHASEADGSQKEEPMCCDNPNSDHHKNEKPAKKKITLVDFLRVNRLHQVFVALSKNITSVSVVAPPMFQQ